MYGVVVFWSVKTLGRGGGEGFIYYFSEGFHFGRLSLSSSCPIFLRHPFKEKKNSTSDVSRLIFVRSKYGNSRKTQKIPKAPTTSRSHQREAIIDSQLYLLFRRLGEIKTKICNRRSWILHDHET